MAAFDGIPLLGPAGTGGAVLYLRNRPKEGGTARLDGGVEVEIGEGVLAAVVRGVPGSDFDTVMGQAPELLNRGLDVFALTGLQAASLDESASIRIGWCGSEGERVVRLWGRLDAVFSMRATVVVRNPDGTIKTDPEPESQPWQESMRYYRMSQVTDDLFDAFRNVYLALESILSAIEPIQVGSNGRAVESESTWFKRALSIVAEDVDLSAFCRGGSGNHVHDIYDELHNRVRNRVFHAKDGLQPLLPQSLESRAQVSEAKERYSALYLAIAGGHFGARLVSGAIQLSESAMESMREATLSRSPTIGFTADTTPFDSAHEQLSPRGESCVVVPTTAIDDPLAAEGYAAVMGRSLVSDHPPEVTAIGRYGLLGSEGEARAIADLEGSLTLEGFQACEFIVSVRAIGGRRRKFIYAT